MLSLDEWNDLVACVKDADRNRADPQYTKLMAELDNIFIMPLFNQSDSVKMCMKCARHSFRVIKVNVKSNECCITGKRDNLMGIQFDMLYDGDNPAKKIYDEDLKSVTWTIHENMYRFVAMVAQLGMIWHYILMCVEEQKEPDYNAYKTASEYIELFMSIYMLTTQV